MREWLRKAVAALPVSMWLLTLGASYVLGTVVHDCVYSRYAEAAFGAGMVVYILPTLVASLRRHPNFWLLLQTNLFLGVTIAGWLVCFVWSCYKHAKTKHMLLSLIIIFVVFGVGIDAFRSCARTEEAVITEAVWQAFSVTGIAAWMVFAGCEAIRVMKNEEERGSDADRLR
jgi:T4 superinfection immunity protein